MAMLDGHKCYVIGDVAFENLSVMDSKLIGLYNLEHGVSFSRLENHNNVGLFKGPVHGVVLEGLYIKSVHMFAYH